MTIKADIRHYFPSIDHTVLKKKLDGIIEDADVKNIVFSIIDSFEASPGRGIPMGNQTSQLFALCYLDELDRLIKEKLRVKYYVRYMDDIIILCRTKEEAKDLLTHATDLVENSLKLEFNEKTQLFPMKNGVEFVGFRFILTKTGKVVRKVRTSTKKRYKKRMKLLKKQYAEGKIDTEDIRRVLPGYNGNLKRGHTYRLKNAVFADFILKRNEDAK